MGDGWFGEVEIGRSIWRDSADRRSLWLAFQSSWEEFDARTLGASEVSRFGLFDDSGGDSFADGLVDDRYQPQGFALTFDHRLSDRLAGYIATGVHYDFSDSELDWHLRTGLSYSVLDSLDVQIEAAYYSDGTAADDSAEAVIGNLGLQYHY